MGSEIPGEGVMIMQWDPVSSSRISAVAWEDGITYMRFRTDGAVYGYKNVTPEQHAEFLRSPSLGKALELFEKQHPYFRVM